MPVTITAGITFSGGGLTMAFAPPSGPTAGWFGSGITSGVTVSLVNRITYAIDTATASVRGPLSLGRKGLVATGNLDYGWFGGGTIAAGSGVLVTLVDRIIYATDTATAGVRGPLSTARGYLGATGNTTDGWFGGGAATSPFVYYSTVDRITYATDTATATTRGPLSSARVNVIATGNTTNGWWAGGYAGSPTPAGFRSTIDRVTFSTDTATASVRGPLNNTNGRMAATGTPTDGWFGGGYRGSIVERVTFSTDTATASVRGPLSSGRSYLAASTDSTTYGWFGGGGSISTVDRITYATDTATATARGPLSSARSYLAATSGVQ